jgi:hypothetical protein
MAMVDGDPTIASISKMGVRQIYTYTDDGQTKHGLRLRETATRCCGQFVPAEDVQRLNSALRMPPEGIELLLVQVGSAEDVDGPALLEQDARGAVFVDQPTKKRMRSERAEKAAQRTADKQKQREKQRDRVLELIRAAARGYYCEHCDAIYHHQGWLQRHIQKHHPHADDDDDNEDQDHNEDDDNDHEDGNDNDGDTDDDDNHIDGGGAVAPSRKGGAAAAPAAAAPAAAASAAAAVVKQSVDHDLWARSQSTAARARTKAEQDEQRVERRRALGTITISARSEEELTDLLKGPFAAFLLPDSATEINRNVAADGTQQAVFSRAPPVYRRGQARPPGERKGFTPTVQVLKLLLPLYHEHKHGTGISMYRLREELIKKVTQQEAYAIPTLEQLAQMWKAENDRNNKKLLAIGSRVVVTNRKKSSSSPPEEEKWNGTIVGRAKAHWYVRRDGDDAANPVAMKAQDFELHESDPLYFSPTHGGRRKATAAV